MRFSTLVAFILPLSALAAPSLVKRDDETRKNLDDALQVTDKALDQIINFGRTPLPQPEIRVLIRRAGSARLTKAIEAEARITSAMKAGKEGEEQDESQVTRNVFESNDRVITLQKDFNKGISGVSGTEAQHDSLAELLSTAVDGVGKAKKFVLTIHGLS